LGLLPTCSTVPYRGPSTTTKVLRSALPPKSFVITSKTTCPPTTTAALSLFTAPGGVVVVVVVEVVVVVVVVVVLVVVVVDGVQLGSASARDELPPAFVLVRSTPLLIHRSTSVCGPHGVVKNESDGVAVPERVCVPVTA
jgi:hypothetical protein